MKRAGIFLILFLIGSVAFGAQDAVYNFDPIEDRTGWSFCVTDGDVDADWELLTATTTSSYAQLGAPSTIEVILGTQTTTDVTIVGIGDVTENAAEVNQQITETIRATTTGTNAGTIRFRYIDYVSSSPEATIAHVIRDRWDTFVTSIPPSKLSDGIAQHFTGDKYSYITGFGVNIESPNSQLTTPEVIIALRFYPDDADCLDNTDGYNEIDRICVNYVENTAFRRYPQPIRCGKDGWIAVFASAEVANSTVTVLMQGYDIRR